MNGLFGRRRVRLAKNPGVLQRWNQSPGSPLHVNRLPGKGDATLKGEKGKGDATLFKGKRGRYPFRRKKKRDPTISRFFLPNSLFPRRKRAEEKGSVAVSPA